MSLFPIKGASSLCTLTETRQMTLYAMGVGVLLPCALVGNGKNNEDYQ